MLIIFDLDDTLIDTTGTIAPLALRRAFATFGRPDEEYFSFLSLNEELGSSKKAILQFAKQVGSDPDLARIAFQEPLPKDVVVGLTPGALEALTLLGGKHTLALVTGGEERFQLEKLKKAGLDQGLFSKIVCVEDLIKKPWFLSLHAEFGGSPRDVLVCGDRVDLDLEPAFALGFQTAQMRWGRGLKAPPPLWVDHVIYDVRELIRII